MPTERKEGAKRRRGVGLAGRRPAQIVIAVAVSLAIHGAIAVTPLMVERPARVVSRQIHFKVLRPKPRPPPLPKPVAAPRPRPRVERPRPKVPRRKLAVARPRAPEPSPLPSVPPVFGATRESVTTGDSSFGVPMGNTVATDPKKRGPVKPGKPSVAPPPPPPEPVRVKVNPRLRREVRVPYPSRARSLGIEGTVSIRVLVGADGRVKESRVLTGPGFGLDEAARRALLRFRFRPAVGTNGKPMPCWITYRYTFQIDD
jgi:protein TonB